MATEPFKYEIQCTHNQKDGYSKLTLKEDIYPGSTCLIIESSANDGPHFRVDEIDELITALTYWRDVYDNDR